MEKAIDICPQGRRIRYMRMMRLKGVGFATRLTWRWWATWIVLGGCAWLGASDRALPGTNSASSREAKPAAVTAVATDDVKSLFDGKSLQGWRKTSFSGSGEVEVKDGQIILEAGNDLTGVNWTNELPRSNYEVTLEAMRVDGSDFFCALTFPVKQDPCTLVVGGWGGGVVGLSSLDGSDASENETTSFTSFKNGQWYRIRLRVTDAKIEAWIDDKKVADVKLAGRRISIRIEVEASKPFGIATWRTTGAIRNIKMRLVGEGRP
jgi:hypothetical protein